MTDLGERIQKADWKKEKHVPVIECADEVKAGEMFDVTAAVGKEIGHPNTTEHHIRWISLYFHPEGEPFTCQVGHFEFLAHGESAKGANEGPVHTHHGITCTMKAAKSGTLHALAHCSIHGLWESSKELTVT